MSIKGYDYAFAPHPSAKDIKAAGAKFVCRYMSAIGINDHNGKNLLATEVKALLDAGIAIVVVEESTAGRMKAGKAAGALDAAHGQAVTKALGLGGVPIYFACDWDAEPQDQIQIDYYLDGAATVIGWNRVGIYGGYYPVERATSTGKAHFGWQTYAWSGGQWSGHAQIRQTGGASVGGIQVDIDEAIATDYGQWPRPAAVSPVPVVAVPRAYAAPEALVVTKHQSLSVNWSAVTVNGTPVTSYTAAAIGLDGKTYATVSSVTTSATFTSLVKGWTYIIHVWAYGGPMAAEHKTLRVTI